MEEVTKQKLTQSEAGRKGGLIAKERGLGFFSPESRAKAAATRARNMKGKPCNLNEPKVHKCIICGEEFATTAGKSVLCKKEDCIKKWYSLPSDIRKSIRKKYYENNRSKLDVADGIDINKILEDNAKVIKKRRSIEKEPDKPNICCICGQEFKSLKKSAVKCMTAVCYYKWRRLPLSVRNEILANKRDIEKRRQVYLDFISRAEQNEAE